MRAIVLGYWHTIITPPMTFARTVVELVEELRRGGINKPIVVSLAGDVEVEHASHYLFDHAFNGRHKRLRNPVDCDLRIVT